MQRQCISYPLESDTQVVNCEKHGCQVSAWFQADIPLTPGHAVKYCVLCGRAVAEAFFPEGDIPVYLPKRMS